MASLETRQVRLRLTTVPYILAELKRKKRLTINDKGEEIFHIQFDSHTFSFRKGAIITVGENIAQCLQSDAFVIVGDALTGPVEPVLEEVSSFDLSTGEVSSPTVCPVCKSEQGSLRGLVKHLSEHEDDENAKEEEAESASGHTAGHTPVPASRRGPGRPKSIPASEDFNDNADPE